MEEKQIKEFALNNGYIDINYIGKWKEYEVYDLIISDKEETAYIGFPLVALVSNEEIKISTAQESIEIIDYFNPPTEEEKANFI